MKTYRHYIVGSVLIYIFILPGISGLIASKSPLYLDLPLAAGILAAAIHYSTYRIIVTEHALISKSLFIQRNLEWRDICGTKMEYGKKTITNSMPISNIKIIGTKSKISVPITIMDGYQILEYLEKYRPDVHISTTINNIEKESKSMYKSLTIFLVILVAFFIYGSMQMLDNMIASSRIEKRILEYSEEVNDFE